VSDLVGKRVLIGITCLGPNGAEVDRFQTYGTVETVGNERIGVRREGLAELFGLPPVPDLFEPAAPGDHTLTAGGERLEDPDYVVSLVVNVVDADALLTLRGLGYVP
jgi:hypothetical protein